MKLLHFFEYCFYRYSSCKFSQKQDKEDPYLAPIAWVTFCQMCNILTIITIYYLIIETKFDFPSVCLTIAITLYLINSFFFLTKKKYEALKERYKDEKNRKRKGWGVALYIFLSFLIWLLVTLIHSRL